MADKSLEQVVREQKCVYRISYENNGTTFENPNETLKNCIGCDGYNLNCRVYLSTKKMRERRYTKQQ